jgi:uncharacterized membrane protein YphA (DoxX/SURF4 family)
MTTADRLALGFDALQAAVACLFMMAGAPKVLGSWRMRAMFDHLGVPQQLLVIVGAVECAAAIGLLVGFHNHVISEAAALIAIPWMAGAMITNLKRSRRRDAWMTTGLLLLMCVLIAFVRWGSGTQVG